MVGDEFMLDDQEIILPLSYQQTLGQKRIPSTSNQLDHYATWTTYQA